jgi:putative MATE family efflux protein
MMAVALIFARDILILMKCQPEVLDLAVTYMRIYFLGMPIIMLYNFVAAILRSVGDSLRPMIFMLISGVINIGFNIFFIAVCNLTVVGVALATVISNLISLILALVVLLRNNGYCKIEFKYLRIFKSEFKEIVKIGIPACLCGLSFYVANLFMSAGVNSISPDAMTANAIAGQFDAIVYNVGMSIAIACMSMVGQCYGAGLMERVKKTVTTSAVYATVASLSLGTLVVVFSGPLLDIMTDSPSVIAIGKQQLTVVCFTHFITSLMEVLSFSLRALHRPNCTMVVGFICGFGVRTFWVTVMWPLLGGAVSTLYFAYGVSAFCAMVIYAVIFSNVMKKEKCIA